MIGCLLSVLRLCKFFLVHTNSCCCNHVESGGKNTWTKNTMEVLVESIAIFAAFEKNCKTRQRKWNTGTSGRLYCHQGKPGRGSENQSCCDECALVVSNWFGSCQKTYKWKWWRAISSCCSRSFFLGLLRQTIKRQNSSWRKGCITGGFQRFGWSKKDSVQQGKGIL